MQTIEDLFRFLFEHEKTVVFTNLGRKPTIVFEILHRDYGNVDVTVVSPYYKFPSQDRIHTCTPDNAKDARCDLLLYAEPMPNIGIDRPPHASRVAVLTSHLQFPRPRDALLASFVYAPVGRSLDTVLLETRRLASIRDPSVQANDAHHVTVDHADARVIEEDSPSSEREEENVGYAILDLTRHTSKTKTFLAFLDGTDRLRNTLPSLRGWLACFKTGTHRGFLQFTQDVQDALHCVQRFEHGNVLDLNRLFALLPFYHSGIVERPLNIPIETFGGGVEYVVPKTELELYHAGTKLDLRPIVGSVYRAMSDHDDDSF